MQNPSNNRLVQIKIDELVGKNVGFQCVKST
uniref:Uncharacterized protein n=1 Tax=Anguilla anguilla TaxID=7936 RepID=A0A0E9S9B3_ANGAN